ncbi:MAG TPA: type IX secretion system outer membrane channel protein PorV [Chitinophagales bacterium]|nr:type IX secretion system outer membrane channel protein PorV [Chitinophagales bacterium]HRK27987.1 type IX secretion system outer membrane channel protein PorV [Chitinophagales bacterium]
MKNLICLFFMAMLMLAGLATAQAQVTTPGQLDGRVNTVFTSIPFLRINPDGRAGGMGDVGLATDPDAASLYHNVGKLAFAPNMVGVSLSYTPWLRQLVNDIYIAYLTGYYKIDDLQSIGLSMRYFSLGSINFTDITGNDAGIYNPNEFAFDLGYSRRLSDKFSTGITLKYVRSDLARGQEVGSGNIVRAAQAVAADIGFYYKAPVNIGRNGSVLSLGAAFSNIGNKVSYLNDDTRDFIPVNAGIGAGLKMRIDDYNTILVTADINKLMVPTPDTLDTNNNLVPDTREKPLLSGMFGSFGDAPGGAKEEFQELMYSIGAEYWYNNQFSVRVGHFNEHRLKGNRKFLTVGLGLRYSVFGFNFSYLIPVSSQRNPLDNTLRFSLTFDFNGKDKELDVID